MSSPPSTATGTAGIHRGTGTGTRTGIGRTGAPPGTSASTTTASAATSPPISSRCCVDPGVYVRSIVVARPAGISKPCCQPSIRFASSGSPSAVACQPGL
jgi:hypothetical protein